MTKIIKWMLNCVIQADRIDLLLNQYFNKNKTLLGTEVILIIISY